MFQDRKVQAEIESMSVHLSRMKQAALKVLAPDPLELEERIALITELSGKAPNMYDLYCASVEWEILSAFESRRKINWDSLDPIMFLMTHAPSLKGKRSGQIVEIAKAEHTEIKQSLYDRIRGGK